MPNAAAGREGRRRGALLAILVIFAPLPAQAYVGPGAGLSAVGSFVALLIAALLLIAGFLWYPLKQWRKRRQARDGASSSEAAAAPSKDAAASASEEDSDRATGL